MPLNVLRLNQKHLHPTPHIVFVKALPGEDAPLAEEFLNRVAAICHPVLKNNHLSVTSLEEFPPNREFVGRNFNNGECVQLVLKSRSGAWLPFRAVVMVMMHELAHNVHMNHSRDFWKVRNAFTEEMRGLWLKGYTGEGVWGPGREMATGVKVGGGRDVEAEMPEHLCGGTYRSRRRKRDRKPEVSWKERRERRIAKKFGLNGQALGQDEVHRMALQGFKGPTTKSRVAGSKRGRELRAAAALARFEQQQVKVEPSSGGGNVESEEEYEAEDAGCDDARDLDGSRLQDEKGYGLIKICGDEDTNDVDVKQEMEELYALDDLPAYKEKPRVNDGSKSLQETPQPDNIDLAENNLQYSSIPTSIVRARKDQSKPLPDVTVLTSQPSEPIFTVSHRMDSPHGEADTAQGDASLCGYAIQKSNEPADAACPVCSMSNDSMALLCLACSNVLKPKKSPGAWKCQKPSCKDGQYLNPADYGVCGVCGSHR